MTDALGRREEGSNRADIDYEQKRQEAIKRQKERKKKSDSKQKDSDRTKKTSSGRTRKSGQGSKTSPRQIGGGGSGKRTVTPQRKGQSRSEYEKSLSEREKKTLGITDKKAQEAVDKASKIQASSQQEFEKQFRQRYASKSGQNYIKTKKSGAKEYYIGGRLARQYTPEGKQRITTGQYQTPSGTRNIQPGRTARTQVAVSQQRRAEQQYYKEKAEYERKKAEFERRQKELQEQRETARWMNVLGEEMPTQGLSLRRQKELAEIERFLKETKNAPYNQKFRERLQKRRDYLKGDSQLERDFSKTDSVWGAQTTRQQLTPELSGERISQLRTKKEAETPDSLIGKTGAVALLSTLQATRGLTKGLFYEGGLAAVGGLSTTPLIPPYLKQQWGLPGTPKFTTATGATLLSGRGPSIGSSLRTEFRRSPEEFAGTIVGGFGSFSSAGRAAEKSLLKGSLRRSVRNIEKEFSGALVTPARARQLEQFGGLPSVKIRASPLESVRVGAETFGTGATKVQRRIVSPQYSAPRLVTPDELSKGTGLFEVTGRRAAVLERTPLLKPSKTPVAPSRVSWESDIKGFATEKQIPTTPEYTLRTSRESYDPKVISRQFGELRFRELTGPEVSKGATRPAKRLSGQRRIPKSPLQIDYQGGIPFAQTKQLEFIPASRYGSITVTKSGRSRGFVYDFKGLQKVDEFSLPAERTSRKPLRFERFQVGKKAGKTARKRSKSVVDALDKELSAESSSTFTGGGFQQILKPPKTVTVLKTPKNIFGTKKKAKTKTKQSQQFGTLSQQDKARLFGLATAKVRGRQYGGFSEAILTRPSAKASGVFGGRKSYSKAMTDALNKAKSRKLSLSMATAGAKTLSKEKTSIAEAKPLSKSKLFTRAKTKALTASKAKTRVKARTLSKTDSMTDTVSKILSTSKTTTSRTPKSKPPKSKTPKPPRMRFDIDSKKPGKKVSGYHAYVKRRGEDVRITDRPLSKNRALNRMVDRIDTTPRASGFIKKSGGKITKRSSVKPSKKLNKEYRTKKTKKGKRYIEKTKFRIDSPKEFQGITMKGLSALNTKRRSKKGIRGIL